MAEQLDYMGVQIDTTKAMTVSGCFLSKGMYSQTDGVTFPGRLELSAAGVSGYTTFTERPCRALASVIVARVYAEGDVRFRAVVSGVEYYWNGAAWVVATLAAHFNTAAQLELGLVDWRLAGGIGSTMGFKVTLVPGAVTPYFYGMRMIWSIRWVSHVESPLRAAGWLDDVLHRVVVKQLESGTNAREWWTSREILTTASATSVSFVFTGTESPCVVLDAKCFDATLDPQLTTPIGTYNSATKIYTYYAALPAGHNRVDMYRVTPTIVYMGNRELFHLSGPGIILENPSVTSKDAPGTPFVVTRGGTFYSIPSASRTELSVDVRIIAETLLDLVALRRAVTRLISDGDRVSPNTGESIGLALQSSFTLSPYGGGLYDGRARLLIRDVSEWEGRLTTGTHTTEALMGLRVTDRGGSSWHSP